MSIMDAIKGAIFEDGTYTKSGDQQIQQPTTRTTKTATKASVVMSKPSSVSTADSKDFESKILEERLALP